MAHPQTDSCLTGLEMCSARRIGRGFDELSIVKLMAQLTIGQTNLAHLKFGQYIPQHRMLKLF